MLRFSFHTTSKWRNCCSD